MRFYIGLIISLLYVNAICAQCPPDGNYILKTQQQVDNFLGSYPDCTELLNHNIEIIVAREDFGAPVENLLALSQLKRINGYLNIYNSDPTEYTNPSLLSLDGLENITKLQSLGLFQLPLLTSLEPITNIDSLLDFSLQRLPGIVNIDFENLHVSEDLRLDCKRISSLSPQIF